MDGVDEIHGPCDSQKPQEVDEHEIPCDRCGLPLDETGIDGEYDGDRCDTCDRYIHGRCLTEFSNMRGDCRLCQACIMNFERTPGILSVRCDCRSLPPCSWERIYGRFPQPDLGTLKQTSGQPNVDRSSQAAGPDLAERGAEIAKVVELRKKLENHLDHMIRYLELDSSGQHPGEFRSSILERVRDTMPWKEQARTSLETGTSSRTKHIYVCIVAEVLINIMNIMPTSEHRV